MFKTDFITHEQEEYYHAQSKSGKYMSSHMLSDFKNSPLLYHKTISGLINEKPSTAFAIGSAAHKIILEGDAFDAEYTVSDGPINPKTGAPYGSTTKAFLEWAETQPGKIISGSDFEFITQLRTSVYFHPIASELLAIGEAEGVARAELCGVPCQIRMDFFSPEHGLIDLKTCAELRWFESDVHRYGYLYQLGFYRAVIRELLGVDVPVGIIAVEKCEPYSAGVWDIAPNVLDQAELVNNAALQRFKRCKETGCWPTGFEDIRLIDTL